jgi:hypothetical protein
MVCRGSQMDPHLLRDLPESGPAAWNFGTYAPESSWRAHHLEDIRLSEVAGGAGDHCLGGAGRGYRTLHCFLHSLICWTHRCTHAVDSSPVVGHSCRQVK